MRRDNIIKFISQFTKESPNGEVIRAFTQGCCYWFAVILADRFKGVIMYDYTIGHFVTRIGHYEYDITGDVTGHYKSEVWSDCSDPNVKRNIIKNSIEMR